jgi:hypothetical protein
LRCTQLADTEACNEALRSNPNDSSVLLAKADGLMQKGRSADAAAIYQHALQLNPGNESMRAKLVAAESRASAAIPPSEATSHETSGALSASRPVRRSHSTLVKDEASGRAQVAPSVPALSTPAIAREGHSAPATAMASSTATPSYSNDAPVGRSN